MNYSEDKYLVAGIRGGIMSMMLNGTIDWVSGNALRAMSDEDLIKEFGEAFDKEFE